MVDPDAMPGLLQEFLAKQDPQLETATVRGYTPMTGGWSRRMARFTVENQDAVTHYVLRGDAPPGQSIFASNSTYEWELLSALTRLGTVPMPAARWFDPDGSALGTKAIVLDYEDGPTLARFAEQSAQSDLAPMAERLCNVVASVHGTDLSALRGIVEHPGDWDSYIDSRIQLFSVTERSCAESDPFLRYLGAWLEEHRPEPVPLTLIHGDVQSPNILVRRDGSFSLVDWELARVGDPREDLGRFALGALVTPPDLIGHDEEAFCARYRSLTGLSEDAVNPATLAYFMILGSIDGVALLLGQVARAFEGGTGTVRTAFHRSSLAFLHAAWMRAVAKVSGARSSKQEPGGALT